MEIRYGVVGEIVGGIYAGWYIFIQEYQSGKFVLIHTSTHHQTRIPNVKSYDTWVENRDSLEATIAYWGITEIVWREDLESDLPAYAD
jgi:hypothetical protein